MSTLYEQSKKPNTGDTALNNDKETKENKIVEADLSLDKEYLETNKVHIDRKDFMNVTTSYYKKMNKEYFAGILPKQVIGSSVSAKRLMFTTSDELRTYLPGVIGVNLKDASFDERAKRWYENISRDVNYDGLDLDISFRWNKKSDYIEYKKKEEDIYNTFETNKKNNVDDLKKLVSARSIAIHTLESNKYQLGKPVNVEDYIIWRHCLLYSDVAKDISLINTSRSIRFYIRDEKREERRRQFLFEIKRKAISKYNEISENITQLRNIALTYGIQSNSVAYDLNDLLSLQMYVYSLMESDHEKFVKVANDKELSTKGTIEQMIRKGILKRLPSSQNILTHDDAHIGANMIEAVLYFNNPANEIMVSTLKKQLNT